MTVILSLRNKNWDAPEVLFLETVNRLQAKRVRKFKKIKFDSDIRLIENIN